MASAAARIGTIVALAGPIALGSTGYAAYKYQWDRAIKRFLTGPGRTSRILLLLFVIFNYKNLPFVWTYRIWSAVVYHMFLRKSPRLGPRSLFKPIIVQSHTPLLEIDYNLHKSNSTYFTDLDAARTHVVTYLCRPALRTLTYNAKTKLVLDPKTQKPVKGSLGIMLGSIECNFKREVSAYQPYEIWSKMLTWDRKWLYIVTHFVPKGTAKPTEWLDPGFAKNKKRGPQDSAGGWERKIIASALSRYVFKIDRLTVHPAIVLGESGLLPERPGGWMSGDEQLGDLAIDLSDVDLAVEGEWDWRRVEAQRRKGMETAAKLNELDDLHTVFDGGNHGALGHFGSA